MTTVPKPTDLDLAGGFTCAYHSWNRLAEVCNEYLTKGRGVRIVGRLKQDRWEDQEGKTRAKVHIVAEHVEFKPKFKTEDAAPAEEQGESGESGEADESAEAVDFPEEVTEAAS